MPWKNVMPMEEKHRFIMLAQSGRFTISELCESFGISRKTGHKWLNRYAEGGIDGLLEKSRAPKNVPLRTEDFIERLIISERRSTARGAERKYKGFCSLSMPLKRLQLSVQLTRY